MVREVREEEEETWKHADSCISGRLFPHNYKQSKSRHLSPIHALNGSTIGMKRNDNSSHGSTIANA